MKCLLLLVGLLLLRFGWFLLLCLHCCSTNTLNFIGFSFVGDLMAFYREKCYFEKGEGTCKVGERADLTGCTPNKPENRLTTQVRLTEIETRAAAKAGIKPETFAKLAVMIKPASKRDLKRPFIMLWHGTSKSGAAGIWTDEGLIAGERGMNASANVGHASQYPEDTGAHSLVLLRAKTNSLDVDPNDQVGDTMEEGLFPEGSMYQSSCTVREAVPVAIFRIEDAKQDGIDALEKGDLAQAIENGVKIVRLRQRRG